MQTLNARDFNSFKTLAKMTQPKLHNAVFHMLQTLYPINQVHKTPDVVYAIGDIPICLVAHMDTVFTSPPTEIFYDKEANVIWSPQGLGADDRAGVFSIFKILAAGYKPHVLFTTDEEIGGIGASNFAENEPCPFENLKYIVELDRANAMDCVFYEGGNEKFEQYVESFGFVTALGTYSDIVEFCPRWNVSGVNLSIGYRDEHSTSEVLFVGQMLATIQKVKNMLDSPPEKEFPFEWADGYYGCKCHKCGKFGSSYMMIPVTVDNHYHRVWYCGDCASDEKDVAWCDGCYEGFKPELLNEKHLCQDCVRKIERLTTAYENTGTIFDDSRAIRSSHRLESGLYAADDDTFW